MGDVLTLVMRWVHICSMAALLGGIIYGRLVFLRSLAGLPPEASAAVQAKAAAAFRPIVLAAVAGLILSGVYNLITNPGHTPRYHMLFGIKFLFALHVFAVAFLITQPVNPRRGRLMTGTIISGLIILLISAYLRRIF
jgi:cytochrome bd-type quinol oxidase subunit 2